MHKTSIVALSALLIALVALASLFFYLRYLTIGAAQPQALDQEALQGIQKSSPVGIAAHSGDLQNALDTYRAVVDSPASTPSAVASAILIGASLPYRVSGTSADAVQNIRDLKKVAADGNVRTFLRAYAELEMVLRYQHSGHDQAVLTEIFKDEPYTSLVVTKKDGTMNISASLRALLMHSHTMSPLYRTASAISFNYVTQLYTQESQGKPLDPALLDGAEKYLAEADDLVKTQGKDQPEGSDRFENYLFDRTAIMQGLAHFKGKPYTTAYKQAFEDIFPVLEASKSKNLDAVGGLALTHALYAAALLEGDHDTAAAKAQIAQALQLQASYALPMDTSALVKWISGARSDNAGVIASATLKRLVSASPAFKALVDSVK